MHSLLYIFFINIKIVLILFFVYSLHFFIQCSVKNIILVLDLMIRGHHSVLSALHHYMCLPSGLLGAYDCTCRTHTHTHTSTHVDGSGFEFENIFI